jgi:hypothetical protein
MPSHHGQLGISLVFLPFDLRGGILVSTKAAHVGSTDWNRYYPLFPDFPPWTPQSSAQWSDAIFCVRERVRYCEGNVKNAEIGFRPCGLVAVPAVQLY